MIRRCLLTLLLLVGITALAPASAAQALPACGVVKICDWQYYSLDQPSIKIGEYAIFCDGSILSYGVQSGYHVYSVYYEWPCA